MSAPLSTSTLGTPGPSRTARSRRTRGGGGSLLARRESMVWLTAGTLILLLTMILGLLGLVVYQGAGTFWPRPLIQLQPVSGPAFLGEPSSVETYEPADHDFQDLPPEVAEEARRGVAAAGGEAVRREIRTGNFELTGEHFRWISDFEIAEESLPEWGLVLERLTWGRFYGFPRAFRIDGEEVASTPAAVWERFEAEHGAVRDRFSERTRIEDVEVGRVADRLEEARLAVRQAALDHGEDSPQVREAEAAFAEVEEEASAEYEALRERIQEIARENERYELVLETADGTEKVLELQDVVLAYPANRLGLGGKLAVFASRWREFLLDRPRSSNSEGGVFPAIFGTVVMTLLMSLVVVPFGVLAALYLREYAKPGPVVSTVRIAVNNLAGVPSIVYGVFGLGFFCYFLGIGIDELFFEARLPNPTYGTGGILWASLTLALLTLPVVIVATEEALAAVPSSMREGSYACGATKWQTIRRIVLPRAMPGIMTGLILAIARGAGEVAPLMLVGALKLAPRLPVEMDGLVPSFHPERSFMHLGFHIYDLGFHSQNSEAAKPMVYTTTLLLIGIIVTLNVCAIWVRGRLRRRFQGSAV